MQLPVHFREHYNLGVGDLVEVSLKKVKGWVTENFITRVQSSHRIYIRKSIREMLSLKLNDLLRVDIEQLPEK